MKGAQISLLFLGFLVTLSSAGYVRNRMVVKPSQTPSYAEQPVKIEVEKEGEEPSEEVDSHHHPTTTKIGDRVLTPTHSTTFTTAGVGDRHMSFTTRQRTKAELEEEALREAEEERVNLEQNQNAKYFFASAVDDGIMDQSQVRQESRDGLKVKGSYSYSDGYVKRTINYEADEDGYRVVSEESEPIGEGPQTDLINGKAEVHTQVEGVDTQYSINADEIVVHHDSTTTTLAPEVKVKTSSVNMKVKQSSYQ